jgi:two-component system, cell cycle sensor histidine kinase and response regulator CckA
MTAPLPPNEVQRLAVLRQYEVLDTPPEQAFDDLTLLAAQICQVPTAMVSLVDENRQWFKSRIGMGATETSRDIAFCAHTILHTDEVLEVRDAKADPRFADSPLVTADPHIRFYAGAPLVAPGGEALGALCVMDRTPRTLTPEQLAGLQALSRHVVAQLELRRRAREAERLLAVAEKSRRALLSVLEDQKRAEMGLRLFRSLMDRSGETIEVIDPPSGRVLDVNEHGCLANGYTREEYLRLTVFDLHPALTRERFAENQQRMRQSGPITVEATHRRNDGVAVPSEISLSLVKLDRDYLVAIIRDITERRQAQREVAREQARFGFIFNSVPVGISLMEQGNPASRIVNPAHARITGIPVEQCQRMDLYRQATHPEDQKRQDELHRRLVAGEIDHYTLEKRYLHPDAPVCTVELTVRVHQDPASGAVQEIGTLIDVSARKQGEAALHESEERFRQLAENINEVFWMTDPATNEMLYVSPAYAAVWGRTCASLYATPGNWVAAIHPDDRKRVVEAALARQARGTYDETYRIARPDGSIRWVRDRAYPIRTAEGKVYRIVGTAEDISDRKDMEVQVMRMQRMESVGRMASGIAHDLNNILAPILMGAPLLRMGLPAGQVEKTLRTIESSARRGADLVRQLLMFGRGAEGRRVLLRPKDLVQEIAEITAQTFPRNLTTTTQVPDDIGTVMGDGTQLHQVLLNLCVNARDAMPQGGNLAIAAKNIRIDESYASMSPEARPGDYVCLSVNDTGTGIPPEILDKIFDPFFTTKEVGKGTGLGLSTLIGIVKSHGGFVTVQSEPGRGSVFQVYLPAEHQAKEAAAGTEAAPPPRGHGETILLVDDEAGIREVTGKMLEQSGYRVLSATDGADACAQFARHAAEIEIVLTDLDMPVMGGLAMIHVLKIMKPDIRVIISSGKASELADKIQQSSGDGLQVDTVLTKPYTAEKVLRVIHDLLAHKPNQDTPLK